MAGTAIVKRILFKLKYLNETKWTSITLDDEDDSDIVMKKIFDIGKVKFSTLTLDIDNFQILCDGAVLENDVLLDFFMENASSKCTTYEIVPKIPTLLLTDDVDGFVTKEDTTIDRSIESDSSFKVQSCSSPNNSLVGDCFPSTSMTIVSSTPNSNQIRTVEVSLIKDKIKQHLQEKPGGTEILEKYRKEKALSEKERKKVVNLTVDLLIESNGQGLYPNKDIVVQYAKATVDLFPSMKDKLSTGGYEMLYDPISHSGYFAWRLRTLRRSCGKKSKKKLYSEELSSEDLHISPRKRKRMEDDVVWLKNSDGTVQADEIKEKMAHTLPIRNELRKTDSRELLKKFPRFCDTPALVNEEFEYLHPDNSNNLLNNFLIHQDNIFKLCKQFTGCKVNSEEDNESWDQTTKTFICLTHLLPPTAKGKKSVRVGASAVVEKLIKFNKTGHSIEEAVVKSNNQQPFILACGPNKSSVSEYFIVVDKKLIPCGKVRSLEAFDTLMKTHFVLNCKYEASLSSFYIFLESFFYGLEPSVPITSRVREVRGMLLNAQEVPDDSS